MALLTRGPTSSACQRSHALSGSPPGRIGNPLPLVQRERQGARANPRVFPRHQRVSGLLPRPLLRIHPELPPFCEKYAGSKRLGRVLRISVLPHIYASPQYVRLWSPRRMLYLVILASPGPELCRNLDAKFGEFTFPELR